MKTQKYQTGALANYKDNRDIKYTDIPAMAVSLPSKHITDISMIPVLDQGALGTCVAHAIATVKMYQEYKETGVAPKFSRRFIYALARTLSPYGADMGLYPRDGAKTLKDNGVLEPDTIDDNTLPHSVYVAFSPDKAQKEAALRWGSGFATINDGDLNTIKQSLVREGVITITLGYQNGKWNRSTGKLSKPTTPESRHYIALYGYEDKDGDTVFYFRNSWSKDWGDKGNGQFNWSEYKTFSYDAIAFTDVPNDLIEKAKNTQYIFTTTMKLKTSSPEVKKLQERLAKEGFYTYPLFTGYFGEVTKAAVIAYQKAKKISPADGVVGPITRAKLNEVQKKNLKSASTDSNSSRTLNGSTMATLAQKLWNRCLILLGIRQ